MAPSGAIPIDPALSDTLPDPAPRFSAENSAVLAVGSSVSTVSAGAVVLSATAPHAVLSKAKRTYTKKSKATIPFTDPSSS
ncbi:Protein of unknown function [Pyronema omphalodes CBS 100304]|uniref:Uncharacterized protein n=1 Tax=Pyronema omphalodes (strain CBS 100304) TaxID=1076935 RepID=U4LFV9_PYROM|nr:Protein of unknown function [Pyronema omphalodes CBS 100304]